jgi:hypothetical protein
MDDGIDGQFEKLERALAEFERESKRALGFIEAMEYKGIHFDVSRRFVIADLSPIVFFHLVERIEADGAEGAVARLHERLRPLLDCHHEWTALKRDDDEAIRQLGRKNVTATVGPHICKRCTAYALSGLLPAVGRTVA